MARVRGDTPEWNRTPKPAKGMTPRVVEAIVRRRRQILVHSYLYYHEGENIISDHLWTHWAQQLAKLQRKYGARVGFYDAAFADFNGSTGHHLPVDSGIANVALRLLAEHREREDIINGPAITKPRKER